MSTDILTIARRVLDLDGTLPPMHHHPTEMWGAVTTEPAGLGDEVASSSFGDDERARAAMAGIAEYRTSAPRLAEFVGEVTFALDRVYNSSGKEVRDAVHGIRAFLGLPVIGAQP